MGGDSYANLILSQTGENIAHEQVVKLAGRETGPNDRDVSGGYEIYDFFYFVILVFIFDR